MSKNTFSALQVYKFFCQNRYCWRRNNFNDIKQSSRVPRKQLNPCFECFYHKCFSANQQNMQHLYGLLSTALIHTNFEVCKTKLSQKKKTGFSPQNWQISGNCKLARVLEDIQSRVATFDEDHIFTFFSNKVQQFTNDVTSQRFMLLNSSFIQSSDIMQAVKLLSA